MVDRPDDDLPALIGILADFGGILNMLSTDLEEVMGKLAGPGCSLSCPTRLLSVPTRSLSASTDALFGFRFISDVPDALAVAPGKFPVRPEEPAVGLDGSAVLPPPHF